MATLTRQQIRFARRPSGDGCRVGRGGEEEKNYYKEDASQTWKVGTLLVADSDGDIEEANTSSDLWITPTSASGAVIGQATLAATGTTDAAVYFWPIKPDDEFIANVYHTTAASAVTHRNMLGKRYRLKKISDLWVVDLENTTLQDTTNAYPWVKVTGFEGTVGDIYGQVRIQFGDFAIGSDGDPQVRICQLA